MTDENNKKKLYDGLYEQGMYTEDFETFDQQFRDPDQREKLYKGLREEKEVTEEVSFEEFNRFYFDESEPLDAENVTDVREEAARAQSRAEDSSLAAGQFAGLQSAAASSTGVTQDAPGSDFAGETSQQTSGQNFEAARLEEAFTQQQQVLEAEQKQQVGQLLFREAELNNKIDEIRAKKRERRSQQRPSERMITSGQQDMDTGDPEDREKDREVNDELINLLRERSEIRDKVEELADIEEVDKVRHFANMLARSVVTEVPAGIFDAAAILDASMQDLQQDFGDAQAEEQWQARVADFIREKGEEWFPGEPELQGRFFNDMFPQALGSLAAFYGGGGAAGAIGKRAAKYGVNRTARKSIAGRTQVPSRYLERLGRASEQAGRKGMGYAQTGFALTAASSGGMSEAYRVAKVRGASEEEARKAGLFGSIPGAIQVFPIVRALNRFQNASKGQFENKIWRYLTEATKGGVEEFTVESAGQVGQNVIREIYEENPDYWENVAKAGQTGGAAGFVGNFIMTALGGRSGARMQQRGRLNPEQEQTERIELGEQAAQPEEARRQAEAGRPEEAVGAEEQEIDSGQIEAAQQLLDRDAPEGRTKDQDYAEAAQVLNQFLPESEQIAIDENTDVLQEQVQEQVLKLQGRDKKQVGDAEGDEADAGADPAEAGPEERLSELMNQVDEIYDSDGNIIDQARHEELVALDRELQETPESPEAETRIHNKPEAERDLPSETAPSQIEVDQLLEEDVTAQFDHVYNTKDGRFQIREKQGSGQDIRVYNKQKGKEVPFNPGAHAGAIGEYLASFKDDRVDQSDLRLGEGIDSAVDMNEAFEKMVARHSGNPAEIAEAYVQHLKERNTRYAEAEAGTLGWAVRKMITDGSRINTADFDALAGEGHRRRLENLRFFSREGMPLDKFAQEVSQELGYEVTEQDIIDFVQSGEAEQTGTLAGELEERFFEVTGFRLSSNLAGRIVENYSPPTMQEINDMAEQATLEQMDSEIARNYRILQLTNDETISREAHEQFAEEKPEYIEALIREAEALESSEQRAAPEGEGEGEQAIEGREQGVAEPRGPPEPAEYGARNRLVSREEVNHAIRDLARRGGQLNMGVDPRALAQAAKVAIFHVEAGTRKFADFAQKVMRDAGQSTAPYLQRLYRQALEQTGHEGDSNREIAAWYQAYFADQQEHAQLIEEVGRASDEGGTLKQFLRRNAGRYPVQDIIKAWNGVRMGYLNDAVESLDKVRKEDPKESGRPELANPAQSEDVRRFVDNVDEARKQQGIPGRRSDAEVIAEADDRLEQDYEGEKERLYGMADEGNIGNWTDVEVRMARKILEQEGVEAIRSNDHDRLIAFAKIADMNRRHASEMGRAFRQLQDDQKSPQERMEEFVKETIDQLDAFAAGDDQLQNIFNQIQQLNEQGINDVLQLPELQKKIAEIKREKDREIARRDRQIQGLQQELEQQRRQATEYQELVDEISRLEGEVARLSGEIEQASTEQQARQRRRTYDRLQQELERLRRKRNETFPEERGPIDQRIAEILNEINSLQNEMARDDTKLAIESLKKRVRNLAKQPKATQEADPVNRMVQQLFNIARSKVRQNGHRTKMENPLDIVADAMNNEEQYRQVWREAQEKLRQEFQGDEQAMQVLQAYFGTIPIIQFHTGRIDRAIQQGLSDLEVRISDLITAHYSSIDIARDQLVDKLIAGLNLTPDQATRLSDWVGRKFDQQVRKAKRKYLERTLTPGERTPTPKKQLYDRIIELTNAGALKYTDFRNALAQKMGWPEMTERQAARIKRLTEEIQQAQTAKARNQGIIELMNYIQSERITGGNMDHTFRTKLNELLDRRMNLEERSDDILDTARRRQVYTLVQAMMLPPRSVRRKLDRIDTQEERDAIYTNYMQNFEKAKSALREQGIDLDNLTEQDLDDPSTLYTIVRTYQSINAKPGDKAYEYFLNSLLSGYQTHFVNISGNSINTFIEFTAQRFVEAALNEVTGKKPDQARMGELPHVYRAFFGSMPKAWNMAKIAFNVERGIFAEEMGQRQPTEKFVEEQERGVAIGGQVGRIIRTPIRSIMFMDEFSKVTSFYGQLAAEAYRQGKTNGYEGQELTNYIEQELHNPHSDSAERAWAVALEHTFQQPAGMITKTALEGRRNIAGSRYVVPFLTTPGNLIKTGLRKSPLGAINLMYRTAQHGAYALGITQDNNFRYERPDAIRHSAEQIIAWGGIAAIGAMYDPDDPVITGTGSSFRQQNRFRYEQQNLPPQSIRIGDHWYSYRRFEPISTMLSLTVDAIEAMHNLGRDQDQSDVFQRYVRQTGQVVWEKSYIQGIGDMVNMLEAPEQSVNWASNFAASWMPNIIKQTARGTDPVVRNWGRFADHFTDDYRREMLRRTLQRAMPAPGVAPKPRVDWLGRDVQKDDSTVPGTDILYRMIVPAQTAPISRRTTYDRAILNWNNQNPNDQWYPSIPARQLTIDGERTRLTEEEYYQYVKRAGELTQQFLDHRSEFIASEADDPSEQLIELLQDQQRRASRQARDELVPQIKQRITEDN